MSLPTTGILDNYNLRYNFGTAVLEMNTGNEVWVAVPINISGELALANGHVFVGNASNTAADVAMTGDVTIANTGATTLGTLTHTLTINPVTNQLILGGVSAGHTVTLTAPAPSANRVYTVPDAGNDASFIMDHGANQFINGNLQVGFMTASEYLLTNNSFLSAINTDHASGSPQNTIIPDTGSGSTSHFVVTETSQTLNGALTLTSALAITPTTNQLVLGTTRTVTISATQPASSSRTYTIPDQGGNANIVGTGAANTFAAIQTFSKAQVLNTSSGGTTGTLTPDATLGPTFTFAVAGAITLNGPTGGYAGQKITYAIDNDASHSVTLATGAGNHRFGTDITAYTNSVSKRDYVGVIYNGSTWDVVSVIQGF